MMEAAVNYLNAVENMRKNRETERNNRRVETETQRSNLAREHENRRSNLAKEAENYRSNRAREVENNRTNVANEDIRRLSAEAQANLQNEQAITERTATRSEKYAKANRYNAQASTEKQKVKTEREKTKSAKAQATMDAANAKHADYRAWVNSIGQTADVAEGISKEVRGWVTGGVSDIGNSTQSTTYVTDPKGHTTTTKSNTTTTKIKRQKGFN